MGVKSLTIAALRVEEGARDVLTQFSIRGESKNEEKYAKCDAIKRTSQNCT